MGLQNLGPNALQNILEFDKELLKIYFDLKI